MPRDIKGEITFPFPPSYRKLSRSKRLVIECSAGLMALALMGIGASMQMPLWLRLTGWVILIGYWIALAVVVMRRWLQRRGWER